MDTAIYLRKSRSEEQQSADETLSKHKEILYTYAEKHDLTIVKEYKESIVSGDNLYSRPEMQKLLEDVDNGLYDAVLCMDIDRLGRGNMREQGLIIETFKYSDTLIITPDKTYNLNDDTDEELTEFKTFFARRELKTINKRLQRGLKQTIKNGGYVANAPYGYEKIYVDKKPTLKIIENEAYFVRMMYNMYLKGIGAQQISEELNKLGAKPRRSEQFNRNTVRHILKNPVFCGKIVWDRYKHIRKGTHNQDKHTRYYNSEDKWIIVDGLHEPIISEDIFSKAQSIRKSKYIPSQNNGECKSILAGLVVCSKCGKKMQRMKMKNVEYLLCNEKGCQTGTKYDMVVDAVIDKIKGTLNELQINYSNYTHIDTKPLKQAIELHTKDIDILLKQKDNLHNLVEQGVYDIDTFKTRNGKLTEQIEKLRIEVKALTDKIAEEESKDLSAFLKTSYSALEAFEKSTIPVKNKLLKAIVNKIEYTKKDRQSEMELTIFLNL